MVQTVLSGMTKKRTILLFLALSLALITVFTLTVGVQDALAKGATVSSVRFSKKSINTTTSYKTVKLKVRAKDSRQIDYVYAQITNGKSETSANYRSKSGYLYLDEGSNRDGTYSADVSFYDTDKGTWRVTYVAIKSQTDETYSYQLKKKKGIGKKIKVIVGPNSSVAVTKFSKSVTAGNKVTLTATVKSKKKAVKKGAVVFYLSYYDQNGNYKYPHYSAKTNKKGVAKKTITMPYAGNYSSSDTSTPKVSVYAYYKGQKNVRKASYSKTKYIVRNWPATAFSAPTTNWAASSTGSKEFKVKLTSGGKALVGKNVKIKLTGYSGSDTLYEGTVKTNASGEAIVTITITRSYSNIDLRAEYAGETAYRNTSIVKEFR